MRVRIKTGIGWNRGLEGEIFRVIDEEEFAKYMNFKCPTYFLPVQHPDNTSGNVKTVKKTNVEIIEEESGVEKFIGNEIVQHPKGSFIKVCRAPKVGDQILIVDSNLPAIYHEKYRNGDILTITKLDEDPSTGIVYCKEVETSGNYNGQIDGHEYVVVKPFLRDPEIGQAYGILKKLGESAGVAAGEIILAIRAVMEVYKKTEPQAKPANPTPKESARDVVIKSAREYLVETLKECHVNDLFKVEFIVNSAKRTVVCLIRNQDNNKVVLKGKAKAARGDCFNTYLGRAISLAKALKTPVPDDFRWAPKPTVASNGCLVSINGGLPFVLGQESYAINSEDRIEIVDDSVRYPL